MIESLKSHLDNKSFKYITYPKFVFLCGKAYSSEDVYYKTNRGVLERFFQARSEDIFIVLSERLWEQSFNSNIDLLTFEDFLAEVSDTIILFVESPGSFCELGAFSYAEKLFSDKLIIVIDEKHKNEKSFIITGPTAKAQKGGARVIYAPVDNNTVLSSKDVRSAIIELINSCKSKTSTINKRVSNTNENFIDISSFIIELLELIKILQPISRKDLLDIYKQVKGFNYFKFVKSDGSEFQNKIEYDYIIKLLENVGLIKLHEDIITSDKHSNYQSLMFKYSTKFENKERNRLLCRKYRYGDIVK